MSAEEFSYVKQVIIESHFPKEWENNFIKYDGYTLPYKDNWFDAILCWYVLEHVEDTEYSLNEMIRVCKSGGCIRLDCPNYADSYEQHYGIDIGVSLKNNRDKLLELVVKAGKDKRLAEELNMIDFDDIKKILLKRNDITVKVLSDPEQIKSNISILICKR